MQRHVYIRRKHRHAQRNQPPACKTLPATEKQQGAQRDFCCTAQVNQVQVLGGQGIRGLSYVASLGGYLVISPKSREKDDFKLWFWSGPAGAAARRVTIEGLQSLQRAEGVSPAVIKGEHHHHRQ